MELETAAGMLEGAFDAEAVVGLALFVFLVVVLARSLVTDHHRAAPVPKRKRTR